MAPLVRRESEFSLMTPTITTHPEAAAAATLRGLPLTVDAAEPCLVCGHDGVQLFADLGHTALANNLTSEPAPAGEPHYPLRVGYCPACWHVQLLDRVPPAAMFTEYCYVSSASSTLREHLGSLAAAAAARLQLGPGELAVDIGSNDGTLLSALGRLQPAACLQGVDPAANLAALARAAGVPTEIAYFNEDTARRLIERHGRRARLITATNSFPHIPELDSYLAGVAALLAPGGRFVVEAHYLGDLLDQLAFDTIYHEHVSYWALGPMRHALRRHGLDVVDVERLPVHHGQLRAWIGHAGEAAPSPAVAALDQAEIEAGLRSPITYTRFARRLEQLRHQMRDAVAGVLNSGQRLAGYGAPAKAATLAAYCGLGPREIAWIADRNPLKQGRYLPGAGIPIVSCERLEQDPPDVLLLFAWNFAPEIMTQLAAFRRAGGRFLVPVPEPHLL